MYPYETAFSNLNPTQSNPFQTFGTGFAQQNPNINPYMFQRSAFSQPTTQPFGFQNPQAYGAQFGQNPLFSQSPQSSQIGSPFISPEEFAGSITGRYGETRSTLGAVDPIFITELSRSARGLQDVADQLEGIHGGQLRDDNQRRALYAVTAHLFYAFGLLSSKGIFITGELPGKTRTEVGGPANACREFGKQLERFVERAATGRGLTEELSRLVERGTTCYAEITRTIEGGESAEQQQRKKAA